MFESQTHNNNDSNNNSNNNDKEKHMSTTYLMHEDTFQYRVFCSEI